MATSASDIAKQLGYKVERWAYQYGRQVRFNNSQQMDAFYDTCAKNGVSVTTVSRIRQREYACVWSEEPEELTAYQ